MNPELIFREGSEWFVEFAPYQDEGLLCFSFPTRERAEAELSSLRAGNPPAQISLRINGYAVTREDILVLGLEATAKKYNALPAKAVSREYLKREVFKWSGGRTSRVG